MHSRKDILSFLVASQKGTWALSLEWMLDFSHCITYRKRVHFIYKFFQQYTKVCKCFLHQYNLNLIVVENEVIILQVVSWDQTSHNVHYKEEKIYNYEMGSFFSKIGIFESNLNFV